MSDDPEVVTVIREWLAKAEGDLVMADRLLAAPDVPPWGVAFHAQQCAEKYLKAFLIARDIPFSKTHDIGELVRLIPARERPDIDPVFAAALTEYAAAGRYPGPSEPTLRKVQEAFEGVKSLREWVRDRLPRPALEP